MGRRIIPEKTRLQVIAAIITGSTYAQAAKQYKISDQTAHNWYLDYCNSLTLNDITDTKTNQIAKLTPRQMLRKKVQSIALASLDGFDRIIKTCTTKEYLESQTAGEVAILADTIANGGVQLSNALNQLGSDDEE